MHPQECVLCRSCTWLAGPHMHLSSSLHAGALQLCPLRICKMLSSSSQTSSSILNDIHHAVVLQDTYCGPLLLVLPPIQIWTLVSTDYQTHKLIAQIAECTFYIIATCFRPLTLTERLVIVAVCDVHVCCVPVLAPLLGKLLRYRIAVFLWHLTCAAYAWVRIAPCMVVDTELDMRWEPYTHSNIVSGCAISVQAMWYHVSDHVCLKCQALRAVSDAKPWWV